MKKASLFVFLLLGLAAFSDSRPGLAETLGPVSAELFDRLEKDGWQTVSPGVMQRPLEGDNVETLGFGADGLRFRLKEMRAQLAFLKREQALHPSREMRTAIRAHRAAVLRVQAALRKAEAAGGLESTGEALVASGDNCSANYDAVATLSPGQGVRVDASASFANPCGYSAEVYAYAYTKATTPDGKVVTMLRADPAPGAFRAGDRVTATASAGVNGVTECFASAYASVTSYDLGITYSQTATSSVCPEQTPFLGAPFAVPGSIKAADFDNGGEGIAYHKGVPYSYTSPYRTTTVGLYDDAVLFLNSGDWLEYTIDVASPGTYSLVAQVSTSTSNGSFHVELDGVDATGPVNVPFTQTWNRWSSTVKSGVRFPAGRHVLRVAVDGTFDGFYSLGIVPAQTPFGGIPRDLPGTFRAVDFDEGGEQISYHDDTIGCEGSCGYRVADVDRWDAVVMKTGAGEWMEYTVNVATTRTYNLIFRVGSQYAGGTFHVEVDGVNVTGPLAFPVTGAWNIFQTVTRTGVSLSAGRRMMRIVVDGGGNLVDQGSFDTITVQ